MAYWKFALAFAFAAVAVLYRIRHFGLWWVWLMLAAAYCVMAVLYQRKRSPHKQ